MVARAIENQCYVLASAQFGEHNDKRTSYGHSLAIDPWGDIVNDAGGYDGIGSTSDSNYMDVMTVHTPGVIICDIDHEKIRSAREKIPLQEHRNLSTFSW